MKSIAPSRRRCERGWMRRPCSTTSATPTRAAALGCAHSRQADGCEPACRPLRRLRAELDVRTLCLARETLAYRSRAGAILHSRCRAWAAARSRSSAVPRCSAAICRRSSTGRCIAAFALSEREAGSDVAALARRARAATATATCSTARRRGSPTPASPISTSCSRAPATAARRASRPLPSMRRRRACASGRTNRNDLAASARRRALRRLPRSGGAAHRRGRRGFQGRDGDARRLSQHGRRGGARLRAPRAGRVGRARDDRACSSARRSPRCSSRKPRSRRWRPTSTRARCSSIAPRGRRMPAPRASRAKRRWRSGSPPRRRGASATARCSSSAARGVTRGEIVERLYRDVRALRIYEGASEIQQVVIAKQVLEARDGRASPRHADGFAEAGLPAPDDMPRRAASICRSCVSRSGSTPPPSCSTATSPPATADVAASSAPGRRVDVRESARPRESHRARARRETWASRREIACCCARRTRRCSRPAGSRCSKPAASP